MEPNFKLLLDEMAGLNRRFDSHDDRWNRRFSDLERGLNDRASAVDSRMSALEESFAKLEADPPAPSASAVASRLATLEAIYADRDEEFTQRLSKLESVCVPIPATGDERVKQLEAATAALASWRPGVDGVLDDVRVAVKKLERSRAHDVFDTTSPGPGLHPTTTKAMASSRDRDVFDAMSHEPGLLPTPTAAAGLTTKPPVMGHHVESTTRDLGSGVITTWIPVPANGTMPNPRPSVRVAGPEWKR